MTASISETLNQQQVATATSQSQQIGSSSTQAITSNRFVFFAAFDGTNNIRTDSGYSGTKQSTNMGVMEELVKSGNTNNANVATGYYAGSGTPGPRPVDEINKCLRITGYCRRMFTRLVTLPHGKRIERTRAA